MKGRNANVDMAVTVTLIFADEAHREAFMEQNGFLDDLGQRVDYDKRKWNDNLSFIVRGISVKGKKKTEKSRK